MLNRKSIKIIVGSILLIGVALLIGLASRSSLFLIQEVRVTGLDENPLLQSVIPKSEIVALAKVPIGKVNLFQFELEPVRKRVSVHPWVKSVTVHQELPSRIRIAIKVRQPKAQILNAGSLMLLDEEGEVFAGSTNPYPGMLPVMSGWDVGDSVALREVLSFLDQWTKEALPKDVRIASLDQSEKTGLRATLIIPLSTSIGANKVTRSILELGMNLDEAWNVSGENLRSTIKYFQQRQWNVQRIWVGDGKKIVVKRMSSP